MDLFKIPLKFLFARQKGGGLNAGGIVQNHNKK